MVVKKAAGDDSQALSERQPLVRYVLVCFERVLARSSRSASNLGLLLFLLLLYGPAGANMAVARTRRRRVLRT